MLTLTKSQTHFVKECRKRIVFVIWKVVLGEVVRLKGTMMPLLVPWGSEALLQAVPSAGAAGRETKAPVGTRFL